MCCYARAVNWRVPLNGLLPVHVHARKVPLGLGRHGGLAQHDHVVLGGVQGLVDPVHAAGHVTGVAGHQHQVADGQQEGGGSEEEEEMEEEEEVS